MRNNLLASELSVKQKITLQIFGSACFIVLDAVVAHRCDQNSCRCKSLLAVNDMTSRPSDNYRPQKIFRLIAINRSLKVLE